MRVTDAMIQDQIIKSLANSQERLFTVQQQISSTKEVTTSSDNPTRFDRASRFKTLAVKNALYLENIEDGLGWNQTGTQALDTLYEALLQIKEEALRARSDTDILNRPRSADTVEAMLEEMLLMGNIRFMGKYLFGGTITKDTPPFSFDGTTVTYNGNDKAISRKVAEDTFLSINTVGSEFSDVFDAALALRDALAANDGPAMDVAIAQIDAAADNLLNAISRGGSQQRKLELTRANLETASINIQSYISQAEDVDLMDAILRFNAQELGFRAALESSTRIMNISILNFI